MQFSLEELNELEQLLLYTLYPESYDDTPSDLNVLLDILDKVETEVSWVTSNY